MNVIPYINAQFEDKGRGPKYDCLGLSISIYKQEYGFNPFPDFGCSYDNTSDWQGIGQCIDSQRGNWVEIDSPVEGAVIVFAIAGRPHHIGVCSGFQQGQAMVLHICEGMRATNERLKSSIWKSRIESIYTYER